MVRVITGESEDVYEHTNKFMLALIYCTFRTRHPHFGLGAVFEPFAQGVKVIEGGKVTQIWRKEAIEKIPQKIGVIDCSHYYIYRMR